MRAAGRRGKGGEDLPPRRHPRHLAVSSGQQFVSTHEYAKVGWQSSTRQVNSATVCSTGHGMHDCPKVG